MKSKRQNLRPGFRIQLMKCLKSPLLLPQISREQQSRLFFLLHHEPLNLQYQRSNTSASPQKMTSTLKQVKSWSIVRPWLSTAVRNIIRNAGAIIGHDYGVITQVKCAYSMGRKEDITIIRAQWAKTTIGSRARSEQQRDLSSLRLL